MKNNKDNIACNFVDHIHEMISENSFKNYDLILKQDFINIDSLKYLSEVKSLLKYFYKFKYANINWKQVSKIFIYFNCAFDFYFYQGSLFDVSIYLKDNYILNYIKQITTKEKYINLITPFNSSILSKTLEEGSQIKILIFSNNDDNEFYYPVFHISFSTNTLTIDLSWKDNDSNLNYLKFLLELWPGLILRLKGFEIWGDEQLDWIQRLLIYCEGSPPCWKLSLSKIVINISIDEIRKIEFFKILKKLKHLYNSLLIIYDVKFENITYEDLFIKLF